MPYKYELFISYASEDRPWAARLYDEFKQRDKVITCFWDRESLKIGDQWQKQLEEALEQSRHFVVLWSDAAKESDWVGPEIERFGAAKRGSTDERTLFYVPLQGRRANLDEIQGLADIKEGDLYKEGAASAAPGGKAAAAWDRIVTRIVGGMQDARQDGRPVPVGLLVATDKQFEDVTPNSRVKGKRLSDYLDKLDLDFADVKARYKPKALDWAPFANGPSIEALLEQIRTEVNARFTKLQAPTIRWKWIDLTEPIAATGNERSDRARSLASTLAVGPSLLVIDPISLYNSDLEDVYDALGACFQTDRVAVFCPSPKGLPEADAVIEDLVKLVGKEHFVKFFDPLPPITAYPYCGFNLTHKAQLARFVSGSLGARLLGGGLGSSFTRHPEGAAR